MDLFVFSCRLLLLRLPRGCCNIEPCTKFGCQQLPNSSSLLRQGIRSLEPSGIDHAFLHNFMPADYEFPLVASRRHIMSQPKMDATWLLLAMHNHRLPKRCMVRLKPNRKA